MFRFAPAPILMAIVGSCGTNSTNPLFFERDLVEESPIVGDWQGFKIEAVGRKAYRMVSQQAIASEKPEVITFRLLNIGDHFFADVEGPMAKRIFTRVSILGDKVYVRGFSDDWLRARLKQFPSDVSHKLERETIKSANGRAEIVEHLVLTAKTAGLQRYVLTFVNDTAAFGGAPQEQYKKTGKIPITTTGLASKKYRTFNYWYEVRMAIYSVSVPKGAKPDVVAKSLDDLSKTVSALPTLGVDLAAAECANDVARIYASMAGAIRDSNDGGRLLEALLRGWTGDPFGVAFEQLQSKKRIQQEVSNCLTKFDKTRVLLTDRYEIEFPAIK